MAKGVLVISIVFLSFLSFVGHYYITSYWYLIFDNTNLMITITAIITTIGAIVGAIVGGLMSFLGNKVGAKDNFKLLKEWNEHNSTKQIIRQLKYTIKTASVARGMLSKIIQDKPKGIALKTINLSLYDADWPRELGMSKLEKAEYEDVITWYTQIDLINDEGNVDIETLVRIYDTHGNKIESIIKKYDFD
jgi:uncharacterized membrane protein YciS (DUF1049 family)